MLHLKTNNNIFKKYCESVENEGKTVAKLKQRETSREL